MMADVSNVVTVDGPAASGKSSVATRLAEHLGVPFVSSGLLYRAAAWLARDGVDATDADAVLARLAAHDVALHAAPGDNRVIIDGADVTDALHSDAVDAAVSTVAAHPEVRAWTNARLREIEGPFVVDGRDMGRDVFPDARAKLFLTARPEVRAARRVGERAADLAAVADAIRKRDAGDVRQTGPAEDAVTIDTSDLDLDAVVARALEVVGRP